MWPEPNMEEILNDSFFKVTSCADYIQDQYGWVPLTVQTRHLKIDSS